MWEIIRFVLFSPSWRSKRRAGEDFIETNHRNPSRHNPEGRFKYCNWLKHNKKLLKAGEIKENMEECFNLYISQKRVPDRDWFLCA